MKTEEPMYDFYKNTYCGTAISESEFPELVKRAEDKLRRFLQY